MTKKTRNRLFALCIIALPFLIFLGFLISDFLAPLPPIQPLPNPNGYDVFVKAGQMVSSNTGAYESMKESQLRELVSANSEALALARSGLSNQCRVPAQYSEGDMSSHLSDLAGLKRLAQAFVAEGRLADMENRSNDAAKSYLDAIHLANESARGGVLIDQLVGTAIEAIGTSYLQKLVLQLDAKSCRETAATLGTFDAQRQTWDEVMQQEQDWSHRAFPGIRYELARIMEHKSLTKAFQKAEQKFKNQQAKTRQLIIDLAARAYELDKGKLPANVSDLIPDYLKAIPPDPFTGTNMVYFPR